MRQKKSLAGEIFTLASIVCIICLLAPVATSALSCSIDLSKDSYDPGEELVAMVSIGSEDYANGSAIAAVLSYSIESLAGKSMILEKIQTISLRGERMIILKQPLSEDFPPGSYVFKAEAESSGSKYPFQKNFTVKGSSDNSIPIIAAAVILIALAAIVFLKRRGN